MFRAYNAKPTNFVQACVFGTEGETRCKLGEHLNFRLPNHTIMHAFQHGCIFFLLLLSYFQG